MLIILYESLTAKVIAAFYDVYHELGFGFLESVYQNALYKELKSRGLKCEPQKKMEVFYKHEKVGIFYADILVNDILLLELKAVNELHASHEAQLLTSVNASIISVGL